MDAPKWTVSELWVYPIKSCKGIPFQQARVGVHGLENDRRFMVVDAETGMFVAQRSDSGLGIAIKSICQIISSLAQNGDMELSAPGMKTAQVYPRLWPGWSDCGREVQVWRSKCEALFADPDTNNWLTEFLSRERPGKYQLVALWPGFIRRAKVGYSQLRFADGYPFLVISQESLDDLNRRIVGDPLPMNRFRPNIVIRGGRPYDEDRLERMVINGVDFEGMELCVRCLTTTTDQETAEQGKEPLTTLATYRRNPVPGGKGVVFGRNFNHLSTGIIQVGDQIQFRQYREAGPCDRD